MKSLDTAIQFPWFYSEARPQQSWSLGRCSYCYSEHVLEKIATFVSSYVLLLQPSKLDKKHAVGLI